MERRIFGLENEYGVTCTLRGQRRLSPDEVARYLFRRVVSWGRSSATSSSPTAPASTSTSAATPSTPRPSATRSYDLVVHDKAGERILEQLLASRRAAPARGGHPRRHLPVQEQHRLGRQQLRLPRELPHQPARRLRPLRRGAHPVPRVAARSTPAPARCCRPPGARMYCISQRAEHIWEGVSSRPPPAAARSSTPATSPTPTPSATAASTSSWATRT